MAINVSVQYNGGLLTDIIPPRAARSEKIKEKRKKSRDASTCLGATQVGVTQVVSVRLAPVQGFLRLVG